MGFVGGDVPEQAYLLPPDVRDWLPAGHLAWAVRDLAAGMDLSAFTGWYRSDGQGRPAYDPAMMVTLICYCYCKGIRSSRAIEAATHDDLGARVICGNTHPDHSTAARFLARHEKAVKGLLVASVTACAREGLVSVDVVAGDGTKIRANASVSANVSAAALNEQIAGLEKLVAAEVDAWIAQARAEDAIQDTLPGDDAGHDEGDDGDDGSRRPARGGRGRKRTAATLARRLDARTRLAEASQARQDEAGQEQAERIERLEARAARAAASAQRLADDADRKARDYQARAQAKAASGARRGPDGRVPVTADASAHVARARQAAAKAADALAQAKAAPAAEAARPGKISTTDPSSKIMPAKNGGYGQLHNVQVLAGKKQVIYAITTHPSPADVAALHPLLSQGRATLDAAGITSPFGVILFDAGYASNANFTAPCEGDLHVAVTREARQTGRLKDGKQRKTMKPSWQHMTSKLAADPGKTLYRQRAGIIEPVFAQLFSRLGRHLNYRDDKTSLELHLWAATHNMLKAIRASHNHTAPATT
jgi:transposase